MTEALEVADGLRLLPVVVKAQIHAGGRGKAGGVKLAKTPKKTCETHRGASFSVCNLVTVQTGPEGKLKFASSSSKRGSTSRDELYISFLIDRAIGCRTICIASAAGGDRDRESRRGNAGEDPPGRDRPRGRE